MRLIGRRFLTVAVATIAVLVPVGKQLAEPQTDDVPIPIVPERTPPGVSLETWRSVRDSDERLAMRLVHNVFLVSGGDFIQVVSPILRVLRRCARFDEYPGHEGGGTRILRAIVDDARAKLQSALVQTPLFHPLAATGIESAAESFPDVYTFTSPAITVLYRLRGSRDQAYEMHRVMWELFQLLNSVLMISEKEYRDTAIGILQARVLETDEWFEELDRLAKAEGRTPP